MLDAATMGTSDAQARSGSAGFFAGHASWRRGLAPAVVIAATFVAYAAALRFGFVYDDHILVVGNDSIRSWHYLPSYFTSHIWSFWYPHLLSNAYRPLLLIWLRLNDALFGLHASGWHFTSVAVHVAVSYLVYRLGLRLMEDTWFALICGLVFGLHPVHIEVVACVSGVDFPLSTLFILASLLAWWRSREPGRKVVWLAASMALCAAALLSKESSLMLPVLIGGIAWIYPTEEGREASALRRLRSALAATVPFFAVTLAYLPLRVWALKGFAHPATELALSTVILTIPSVVLFYLRLLVWPVRLSCYYDATYVSAPTLKGFVLPLVVILAVSGGLVYSYHRMRATPPRPARALAFAIFWWAIFLAPALNVRLLPEGEIVHDRYLYLPSVGFAIFVAVALQHAFPAALRALVRPAWRVIAFTAACALMIYSTVSQSLYWADDLSLTFHAHEIAPHNVDAMASLGAAVAGRGMDAAAIEMYKQALQIRPNLWRANVNLAYLYYAHGNLPEAARFFAQACSADPTDGDQFLYLGMALLRMGQVSEAEKAVRTALLVRPQGKNYHLGLGMVLRQAGRLPEAREEMAAELAQDPQNAQARTLSQEITRQMRAQADNPANGKSPDQHSFGIK